MTKEKLPGLILTEGDTFVAFTYGGQQCPARAECESTFHLQESPRAIRGKLTGNREQCLITRDERWASNVQVLEPRKLR